MNKQALTVALSYAEWATLWETSGDFMRKGNAPDCWRLVVLDRSQPISLTNVMIQQNPRKQGTPRTVRCAISSVQFVPAGPPQRPYRNLRTLTLCEWIAEMRSNISK